MWPGTMASDGFMFLYLKAYVHYLILERGGMVMARSQDNGRIVLLIHRVMIIAISMNAGFVDNRHIG